MLEKGLVQIYTGSGKGKTTAAFGLALRSAGHGNNVLIYQFLKPTLTDRPVIGERVAVQTIDSITVKALEEPWDRRTSFDDAEAVQNMQAAIAKVCGEIAKWAVEGAYDVIILDEIVFCVNKDLARLADVRSIIEKKAPMVELVLTGRGAGPELIELADLVTEMKAIKHPYEKGIAARRGIEY